MAERGRQESEPMKILIIVLQFPPAPSGGAEKQCWEQARSLAVRGHDVTVLTEWWAWQSRKNEMKEGVRILRLGWVLPLVTLARRLHDRLGVWWRSRQRGWRGSSSETPNPDAIYSAKPRRRRFRFMAPVEWMGQLSFILAVAWAVSLRRWTADVVHVHESHWLAGFAHWVAERLHAPVVCTEHNGIEALAWPGMPDVPWLSCWKRRRNGCLFLSISPAIRRSLEEKGVPALRIVDVLNGVEIPTQTAKVAEQNEIIYVGNFTQGAAKAFDVLFQAWGKVHRLESAARLHIYGGGDAEPWKRFAREAGCGDSVLFQGKTNSVTEKLLAAGVFVLPSRWEGLSCALLEAQAAGLPAVVSDIEGNLEIVEDGVNGLVVPVENPDALSLAILRLYRSPPLRQLMGAAARKRTADHFAIAKIAQQLEQVYERAIASGRAEIGTSHFHS